MAGVGPDDNYMLFVIMLTLLCTAITAIVYAQRLSHYQILQQTVEAARSLAGRPNTDRDDRERLLVEQTGGRCQSRDEQPGGSPAEWGGYAPAARRAPGQRGTERPGPAGSPAGRRAPLGAAIGRTPAGARQAHAALYEPGSGRGASHRSERNAPRRGGAGRSRIERAHRVSS